MIVPDMGLLWAVWITSAALWLGLSVLVVRRWKLPQPPAPWIILGVAAAVRVGYVLLMPPALSDDIWRYLHDGQTLAAGQNPYVVAPLEVIEAAEAEGDAAAEAVAWMRWINNPELVTIYLPTSQWVFAAISKACDVLAGGDCGVMARQRAFRLVFAAADLLIAGLLIARLKAAGRSAWWAVLFAWSPLVIAETSWSGHQDGIGIALLVGGLMLAERGTRLAATGSDPGGGKGSWSALLWAGALLGLAAGVKPIVLPLALPLGWGLVRECGFKQGMKRTAAACGVGVAVLLALYVPFLLMDGGMTGLFETSRYFVETWRFNGSIHALVEWTVRPALGGEPWEVATRAKSIADAVCGGLLVLVLLISSGFQRDVWRVGATLFFALVCLTSTVHPWYLLWAAALLPVAWAGVREDVKSFRGLVVGPAVWVATLTLPWSYVAWVNYANGGAFDGEYQPGLAVTWMVWVPVYVALGWGVMRRKAPGG
ncbi:MAG: hypothetical protein AAF333_08445 [Planctomycetota bacterium]